MHNMVIENEYVKNLDYIFYELIGHPVRVQRREEKGGMFYSLIQCNLKQ
jgi:hypothetical protein